MSKKILIDGNELARIGKFGEDKFQELCNRANLSCSRVEPDRIGKDFVVSFPLDEMNYLISYDMRPAPRYVSVQIKTIISTKNAAKLTLTVAERLARDSGPALICIFRYDINKRDLVDMTFIHILGDALAKILRRLRLESQKGNKSLHKAELSFALSSGRAVDMNESALLAELYSLPLPDMQQYQNNKQTQIDTLGFEKHRMTIKLEFQGVHREDLFDAILDQKQIKVAKQSVLETRFGISLPKSDLLSADSSGAIRFDPNVSDQGLLVSTDMEGGDEYSVPADLFVAALSSATEDKRGMVRWRNGTVKIDLADQKFDVTISLKPEQELSLSAWLLEMRFLIQILSSVRILKFRGTDHDLGFGKVEWTGETDLDSHRCVLKFLESYDGIFQIAGDRGYEFSLKSILDTYRHMNALEEIKNRKIVIKGILKNRTDEEETVKSGVFVSAVKISNKCIGLSFPLLVSFEKTQDVLTFEAKQVGNANFEWLIDDTRQSFDEFESRIKRISHSSLAIVQTIEDYTSENRTLLG